MKLVALSVRDVKAEHYGRPMFVLTVNEGIRSFRMECENEDSMLSRFPEDYHLFRVGEFDQLTGELVGCVPVSLCGALEFVKRPVVGQQLELIGREEVAS